MNVFADDNKETVGKLVDIDSDVLNDSIPSSIGQIIYDSVMKFDIKDNKKND